MVKKENEITVLGIEGGATRTVVLWAAPGGVLKRRLEFGPGNARLLSDAQLLRLLSEIAGRLPVADALAIGLAGVRNSADRQRVLRIAAKVWPGIPGYATNDLETALAGTCREKDAMAAVRVLVLSGTGSCCYGRTLKGPAVKVGGWGHLLGDRGSAYDIGLDALHRVLVAFDHDGVWPSLGQRLLRTLQLNEPEDLIDWIHRAPKASVAGLAKEVFTAADQGDTLARSVVQGAASRLAEDAAACARRLAGRRQPVAFVLAGGALRPDSRYARSVCWQIKRLRPQADFVALQRESAWGAVVLAESLLADQDAVAPLPVPPRSMVPKRARSVGLEAFHEQDALTKAPADLQELAASPTEQRHPKSMNLDKLPVAAGVDLMLSEETKVAAALRAEREKIARVIKLIVRAFRHGGRLFYVGAGTSGRLGVLDASECPPTFRSPPEQVQGIIAGGQQALWQSVEDAEDDAPAGARAMVYQRINQRDVVVGITASGRTPFVWGALEEARRRNAATVLLAFNPHLKIPAGKRPTVVITPRIGPEILTGSTRLKAGTATKIILNMFTTLAMVKTGKVISNLMVDLHPANTKLRDRAIRILCALTGVDAPAARRALELSQWRVKEARRKLVKAGSKQAKSAPKNQS